MRGGEYMPTRRKILPVTLATVFGLSVMLSALPVYAQTPTQTPTKVAFFDGLVKFIADKFNLDQEQVKSAINEYQASHQAEMQKKREIEMKSRLDQLVKDGKITQEQETAIIAEMKVLQDKYKVGTKDSMSPQDHKAQFDAMREEIQAWSKEHNIDAKYLMPGFSGKVKMGMRHGMGNNHLPTITVTPTP